MTDEDLRRFHNGDTLGSIPVIRDDEPRPSVPWKTVWGAVGTAVLVGGIVGSAFAMGSRKHHAPEAEAVPSVSATVSVLPQPSVVTATATATVVAPTETQTVLTVPSADPGHDESATAESVVEQYYAAVNSGDYASAWELGGKNLSPSYSAFVAGYADTLSVGVTVTAASGGEVYVNLQATRTDGSGAYYTGSYTVDTSRYEITSGQLSEV